MTKQRFSQSARDKKYPQTMEQRISSLEKKNDKNKDDQAEI